MLERGNLMNNDKGKVWRLASTAMSNDFLPYCLHKQVYYTGQSMTNKLHRKLVSMSNMNMPAWYQLLPPQKRIKIKNTQAILNHFAVHLKLTQHCKSNILQYKIKILRIL